MRPLRSSGSKLIHRVGPDLLDSDHFGQSRGSSSAASDELAADAPIRGNSDWRIVIPRIRMVGLRHAFNVHRLVGERK
jgi:hypothetical protein